MGPDVRDLLNNPAHLSEILEEEDDQLGKLFILEGVYSMEGHIVKLPPFVELAKKHQAFVVMDDAHGFGVLEIVMERPIILD